MMMIVLAHHLVNMTEYNYSPKAIEQHLAMQQHIGHWVNQTLERLPANPFTTLPSKHSSSAQMS